MISSVTQLQQILETDYGMQQIKSLKEIKNSETFEFKVEGNMVTIFLPEVYAKKDRTAFLEQDFLREFSSHKPTFEKVTKYSSAGHVVFPGSAVKVIAKTKMKGAPGTSDRGIGFEEDLIKDLKKVKDNKVGYRYPSFIDEFTSSLKNPIIDVIPTGALNTRRPLAVQGKQLYISVNGQGRNERIGPAVADIKLTTTANKTINLSLKFGPTVAFFGSGIVSAFPQDSFKKGKITTPIGEAILDTFGIDHGRFLSTFLNYSGSSFQKKENKAPKLVETPKINKGNLESFIRTMIGYDYQLVHGYANGYVHNIDMTPSMLTRASRVTSDIIVKYPVGGSAKRIDMFVSTEIFDLNFNIRAKDAGVFPTHLVCNYKTKHGH